MYRSIRFRTVTIVLALLFNIVATTSNGVQTVQGPKIQGTDDIVLVELNSLVSSMGAIYQAMLALRRQAHEMKQDKLREMQVNREQKLKSSQEAVEAKRRQIEEERKAARDAWSAAMIAAMASCTTIVSGVATTGSSVRTLCDAPDKHRLQRFTANTDTLKRGLTKLNGEINHLRDILNSGKINSVPENDLEKMKTQLENSLQQLRNMKQFSMERVKKRRDE